MTISSNPPDTSHSNLRVPIIDVSRGFALIAMAVYHFTWDLGFFGWIAPDTALRGGWLVFARSIATSFLFLVGVSLTLAHHQSIAWHSFWKRFVQVSAAAAAISLVTYFAVPGGFIFFGILHGIALFSLLGLFYVQRKWWISLLTAAFIFAIWLSFSNDLFSNPALWWVGLAPVAPPSNDYVPLFPWFGVVLIGIGTTQFLLNSPAWERIRHLSLPTTVQNPLTFIGRRALIFYLLHQPILIGMLFVFTTFIMQPDRRPQFLSQCQQACTLDRSDSYCATFCNCMLEEMTKAELFSGFLNQTLTQEQNSGLRASRDICIAQQD
ncbi:MAG: heparan-alpha-glucosaminide N-acetyltransferase [Rhizobiaceae bacterium]